MKPLVTVIVSSCGQHFIPGTHGGEQINTDIPTSSVLEGDGQGDVFKFRYFLLTSLTCDGVDGD